MTLLLLPLTSTGATAPNLGDQLRSGVNKTLRGVNDVVARLREEERKRREREAARRRAAQPRQAAPNPQGQGYVPPLHGQNPHGQGTPATTDLPASDDRPMPANPAGGNGEILVAGRSRGEQNPNGTFHGHITIAALFGNEVVGVDTQQGQTRAGPLDAIQQGLLDPICDGTENQICLIVLRADSTTTANGSFNRFSTARARLGGPTGITTGVAESNGNITQDQNCQSAHGDSSVVDASIGTFTADAIQASSDSTECKNGTQTVNNTSRVVNLGQAGVALPPLITQACATGVPNSPVLIPVLLPAICNANEVNAAQAGAPYGVREGLTTFALAVNNMNALLKATTGASESRARRKAQCSDGVDNDGDGRIDFGNDPGCTGPTDDDETDAAAADDGGREGERDRRRAECEDGRDNDGDGLIDFPNDPGCTSRSDDSEANAGGAGVGGAGRGGGGAECEDGIDNDGDGRIDFPNDPQCTSPSDDSEADGGAGLAFTGTNLLLTFLIGALVLLAGLWLRGLVSGRSRRTRTT